MDTLTRRFTPRLTGAVTPARLVRWWPLALAPVYLALAPLLPLSDDELYYWCWAQSLQFSYYDHPPMVALLIRASTAVFGDTLFAVRFPAVVATLVVLGVIAALTRPRDLLPWVVATPLFTIGAVVVTPDTPLMMFWALYLLWLVRVHQKMGAAPSPAHPFSPSPPFPVWVLGGVVLGCGILGKYTTGLAVMGGFLSFLLAGNWRRWAAGYALHLGVAFLVTLPILVHNIRHDFVPLMYQWRHSMSSHAPGVKPFLEFAGVQVLFFGLLPFVVFAWSARNWRELAADPRLRPCLALFTFPFAFFLYKSTRGPLEGNWALACYIAVWPLAAVWYERARASRFWRRFGRAAFSIPLGCVILATVHLVWPISLIPRASDRITRGYAKQRMLDEAVPQIVSLAAGEPIFVPEYQWVAMLRFRGVDARQVPARADIDFGRPSHFTQNPENVTDRTRLVVFSEGFLPYEITPGFAEPKILAGFPLVVRGETITRYWVIEYNKELPQPNPPNPLP